MQFASVAGLQAAFSPANFRSAWARGTQGANKAATEGFSPPGLKSLTNVAGTKKGIAPGRAAKGLGPHDATPNGLEPVAAGFVANAASQFSVSRSPRTVLALMGRFRWRPPLKLYPKLAANPPRSSRSTVKFAC